MNLKKTLKTLPDEPGVYIFKDKKGEVLYVGKALSLKKRVSSYFQSAGGNIKKKMLSEKAARIDYVLAESEAEALLYEAQFIKKHLPKYNVLLKDDKAYPLLKVTVGELYPRLLITRKKKDDNALYFGPFTDAGLLREAVKFLRRSFPLRSCNVIPRKACLYHHLGLCLAPCIKECSAGEYDVAVKEIILFLNGKYDKLIKSLRFRMSVFSKNKEYEKAARARDQVSAFSKLISKRPLGGFTDCLSDLKRVLKLSKLPRKIDAFDVSNIFGQQSVGAVVRFYDGRPDKKCYRRFKIKVKAGIDDYGMMREIVFRRYKHLKSGDINLPDLIIIDGGRGHLNTARRVLERLNITAPIIGIAKERELIYLPQRPVPLKLAPNIKALQAIQRIRDEAHRFAIGYHHILRKKLSSKSILKEIRGVGPKRYKSLLRRFGDINRIKKAGLMELREAELINEKTARGIIEYFKKLH